MVAASQSDNGTRNNGSERPQSRIGAHGEGAVTQREVAARLSGQMKEPHTFYDALPPAVRQVLFTENASNVIGSGFLEGALHGIATNAITEGQEEIANDLATLYHYCPVKRVG